MWAGAPWADAPWADGPAIAGGAKTQSLAATLDSVTVAVQQNLSHSQALAATLADITFAAAQALQHAQSLAPTLDSITAAVAQTKTGNRTQVAAFTLDSITFSAVQTKSAGITQSLVATLAGVSFSAVQSLRHSQQLSATLDGITFLAQQQGPQPVANARVLQLNIALDGSLVRNFELDEGLPYQIQVIVYARDGDLTPLTVTDGFLTAPETANYRARRLGESFTALADYLQRFPYTIQGYVSGRLLTIASGFLTVRQTGEPEIGWTPNPRHDYRGIWQ